MKAHPQLKLLFGCIIAEASDSKNPAEVAAGIANNLGTFLGISKFKKLGLSQEILAKLEIMGENCPFDFFVFRLPQMNTLTKETIRIIREKVHYRIPIIVLVDSSNKQDQMFFDEEAVLMSILTREAILGEIQQKLLEWLAPSEGIVLFDQGVNFVYEGQYNDALLPFCQAKIYCPFYSLFIHFLVIDCYWKQRTDPSMRRRALDELNELVDPEKIFSYKGLDFLFRFFNESIQEFTEENVFINEKIYRENFVKKLDKILIPPTQDKLPYFVKSIEFFADKAPKSVQEIQQLLEAYQSILFSKDHLDECYKVGTALIGQVKYSDLGMHLFERVIKEHPDYSQFYIPLALKMKDMSAKVEGNQLLKKAIKILKDSLMFNDHNFQVLYTLAGFLKIANQYEDAKLYVEKALAVKPNHPKALKLLHLIKKVR
ncbi:hypothetical protein WDW89_23955 [Deltaproteobacteria bacterium TL4]